MREASGWSAIDAEPDRYVVISDSQLRLLAVSDDYASLLGYESHELVGRSGFELVADVESARERHAAIKRDGRRADVVTLLHRSGLRVPFAYHVRALSDGTFVTVGGPVAPVRPVLLTKQEAAAVARVHVRTVERAAARGELQMLGTRGRRRIELGELQRWLLSWSVLILFVLLLAALAFAIVVHDFAVDDVVELLERAA